MDCCMESSGSDPSTLEGPFFRLLFGNITHGMIDGNDRRGVREQGEALGGSGVGAKLCKVRRHTDAGMALGGWRQAVSA